MNMGLWLSRHLLYRLCLFIALVSYCFGPEQVLANSDRKVLILYSLPHDFPATVLAEQGIREVLDSRADMPVQLFNEYLDLSRFHTLEQRQALTRLLQQRYGQVQLDAVLTVDMPAASFLVENEQELFAGIPVIMCMLPEAYKERVLDSPLRGRVGGILEPTSVVREHVRAALALFPHTRQAVLIAGSYEADLLHAQALRLELDSLKKKLLVTDLGGETWRDILLRCATLPKDSLIFFSSMFVDASGQSFIPTEMLRQLKARGQRPIFGVYESYLGAGVVGGPIILMREQARQAALMTRDLLQGMPLHRLNFDSGERTWALIYDWRELQRHGIEEFRLPANAELRHRQSTIWDQYKHWLVSALVLMLVQSGLILGLIINLRTRRRVEGELRESQEDLKALAGKLIALREEELKRLARVFHDDLVQRLAALAIETGSLELHAGPEQPATLQKISRVKHQLIALSEDLHALSRELHPSILKDLGLERAVRALCQNVMDREDLIIRLESEAMPARLAPEAALCVYRVIQEGLRNICKHARASKVEIRLRLLEAQLMVTMIDNGQGFILECGRHTTGIGLAIMRERARLLNGVLSIQSTPGQGTCIALTLPLNGAEDEKSATYLGG